MRNELHVFGQVIMERFTASGYLCGDCVDGNGVSALLNRCVTCSNAFGLLIPALGRYGYVLLL